MEDLFLDASPCLVVQRMSDVAKRPVLPLLARHGDEQPVSTLDDLDVAHHETLIEDDGDERLELLLLNGEDPDLRDIHRCGPSLRTARVRPFLMREPWPCTRPPRRFDPATYARTVTFGSVMSTRERLVPPRHRVQRPPIRCRT